MIRRLVLLLLLVVTGLALQTSILSAITLQGTRPEFLLLIVVAVAMTDGETMGALTGFACGIITDSVAGLPQGISALTFTLAGYSVGRMRSQVATPSAWLPMGVVAFTTFLAIGFYGVFSLILGQETLTVGRILRHATFSAMYGALLTPFAFPVVRALAKRLAPRTPSEGLI